MNNTQISNHQESAKRKHNKTLNNEQVDVLQFLYRFRFATSKQIAQYQQKQGNKPLQRRLKILEDQDFIAKRYEKRYKLQGKPAAYYLRPKGARFLETATSREPDEPINLRRIYRDKDVSENFIEHCLHIVQTFLLVSQPSKNRTKHSFINYLTKSQLDYPTYDYFPSPLPDAYIYLKMPETEREFFLDIYEATQPYFVLVRRIKYYFNYASDGSWDDTTPTILIVCANTSIQKRTRKRIVKELRDSYEQLTFATTTLTELLNDESNTKIWLPIDEDGDDPDEPREPLTLSSF